MNNKLKTSLSIILASLTFSAVADNQAQSSETATPNSGPTFQASCSPQPECFEEETYKSAFQKWLENLQQQQLQELLGIEPAEPTVTSENTEG